MGRSGTRVHKVNFNRLIKTLGPIGGDQGGGEGTAPKIMIGYFGPDGKCNVA